MSRLLGELGGADPHDILGLPATASKEEVEAAFRRRSKTLHPDRRSSEDPVADRDWLRLCTARELLGRFGDDYAALLRSSGSVEGEDASSDREPTAPDSTSRPDRAHEPGDTDTRWDPWAEPYEGGGYRDVGPTSWSPPPSPPRQEPPPFRPHQADRPSFRPHDQPAAPVPPFTPPAYAVPHHPSPPPYRPSMPSYRPMKTPLNTMAIAALVASFVIAPLGLVLGLVALVRIAQTGERGRGLAITAMVIGVVYAMVVLSAVAGASSPAPSYASEQAVEAQIESQLGGRAENARCTEDLPARVGAAIRCTATLDGRSRQPVAVSVSSVEGSTIRFDITTDS
ncbi:DUF4190 domain-containing protein [Actinomycetospora termitidis]|uniref:DUF4190 domain-containing protein n=1 Tax=Actinomycetospora termitidis TaxID=3053470 RepID=A0ABT7MG63_9PSEU|nr:DUF4190 domain-containing protein [Actinomycetospora sp. Odt1-22]MDL5158952.1 DUF4190 domain-containing protein [Actinomycetospora sp. Odt1-22]